MEERARSHLLSLQRKHCWRCLVGPASDEENRSIDTEMIITRVMVRNYVYSKRIPSILSFSTLVQFTTTTMSITRIGVPARPIPWPGSVATSVTFPSRRIGQADDLDRTFLSYFIKNPSIFLEIKPAVHPSLSAKFSKNPQILPKPTRSPLPPDQQYFPKDPLHFLKINPPSFLSLRNYH